MIACTKCGKEDFIMVCKPCKEVLSSPKSEDGGNEEIAKEISRQVFPWDTKVAPRNEEFKCLAGWIKEALDQKDAERHSVEIELKTARMIAENNKQWAEKLDAEKAVLQEKIDSLTKENSELKESLSELDKSFVINCLVILKADQKEPLFTSLREGIVVKLDGYAVVPIEKYDSLSKKNQALVEALKPFSKMWADYLHLDNGKSVVAIEGNWKNGKGAIEFVQGIIDNAKEALEKNKENK